MGGIQGPLALTRWADITERERTNAGCRPVVGWFVGWFVGRAETVVDLPRIGPDGGRCADISSACRVGGSTTVRVFT